MSRLFMSFGDRQVDLSRPVVMGVLNVTPDSFSDGGQFQGVDAALRQAETMARQGATFVDVGGESTRPGAEPLSAEQELARVCPVIERIKENIDVVVSVDTSTPAVMTESVKLGAGLINDVRALRREGAMFAAAEANVPVCLMHMQGEPDTMQQNPSYTDVVDEVSGFLKKRIADAQFAGIDPSKILVDPGFGFGKTLEHNLALLSGLGRLGSLGVPVLAGMSRKSMIGLVLDKPVDERLIGSVAAATIAVMNGARIIRVHDVAETVDAIKIATAVLEVE